MKIRRIILTVVLLIFIVIFLVMIIAIPGILTPEHAAPGHPAAAAQAINALGLDLLAKGTVPRDNALLSPYSIQTALAMTYAGAAGDTRAEMARVLHYAGDEAELHASFAALQQALAEVTRRTTAQAEQAKRFGGGGDPITLTVVNRLFGQMGYDFRSPYLKLIKKTYRAPFQPMDFIRKYAAARLEINGWVEQQTRQRVRDLIPADGLNRDTRLVLVNAIYMKASWAKVFPEEATQPAPFHLYDGTAQDVPTMVHQGYFGYTRREGYQAITIPYLGGDLQFLILLPDAIDGLAALEAKLTPEELAACAGARSSDVNLHLPKFKMEPPLFRLGKVLQSLGMKSAFDQPRGSANFDRMAPRKPDDYLYISEVFHKTFLSLDEKGTEAAAVTAAVFETLGSAPAPLDVRVDHPFSFAIQHRSSGACLFLGRITQPR